MICNGCKEEIAENARFCWLCGTAVNMHASATSFTSDPAGKLIALRIPGATWGKHSQSSISVIMDPDEARILRDALTTELGQE